MVSVCHFSIVLGGSSRAENGNLPALSFFVQTLVNNVLLAVGGAMFSTSAFILALYWTRQEPNKQYSVDEVDDRGRHGLVFEFNTSVLSTDGFVETQETDGRGWRGGGVEVVWLLWYSKLFLVFLYRKTNLT